MANWISSKLKVAETFFEQIDQQAAESLKKGENPRLDFQDVGFRKSGGSVALKDQLKKKVPEKNGDLGKLRKSFYCVDASSNVTGIREVSSSSKLSLNPNCSPNDSDWTELLSTPNQPSSPIVSRGNKVLPIRRLRKDSKKQGKSIGPDLNFSVSELKTNQKGSSSSSNSVGRSAERGNSSASSESSSNGKSSDFTEFGSSSLDAVGSTSNVELQNEGKYLDREDVDNKGIDENLVVELEVTDETSKENTKHFDSKNVVSEDFSRTLSKNSLLEVKPVSVGNDVRGQVRTMVRGKCETNAVSQSSAAATKRGSSSSTDGGSDSDDSGLSSDSENEGEREERKRRREKILLEKAAAKAAEAIKERENKVARLEGEKQSLEKILEEQAKQQAQEASDLQNAMMQMMEAVDLEKQKHNNTRMEALARLAKLETANAALARSLATAQWNLEVEVNRITGLKQQSEMKEVAHEELRSKISNSRQSKSSLKQVTASKGFQMEREMLESEYAFISDKVKRLQDKAKELETNIEMARKEIEDPTEVEVELKRRLGQLTDHLIQKQSQVEALSSEKASMLFRIEAISRMLNENKDITDPSIRDLESGTGSISRTNWKPLFDEKLHSGRKRFGSLLVQLDAIFSAGAAFLRRNSTAKVWGMVYLVCLHLWVIYILKSYSEPYIEVRSGAVVSLENISNTGRV